MSLDNQQWQKTGNPQTDPIKDFLGTTDNQDLSIRTNNTEKVKITKTGNVGIGVTNPLVPLEFSDNFFGASAAQGRSMITLYGNNSTNMYQRYGVGVINKGDGGQLNLNVDTLASSVSVTVATSATTDREVARFTGDGQFLLNAPKASIISGKAPAMVQIIQRAGFDGMHIVSNSTNDVLNLANAKNSGDINFVSFSKGTAQNYAGNIFSSFATNTMMFGNPSDKNLKEKILKVNTGDSLGIINKLNVVNYEWKGKHTTTGVQKGLIAQEVINIIPNAVSKGDDDAIYGDDETVEVNEKEELMSEVWAKYKAMPEDPIKGDAMYNPELKITEKADRLAEIKAMKVVKKNMKGIVKVGKKPYTISYDQIIPDLIGSIQQLTAQNQELFARLDALDGGKKKLEIQQAQETETVPAIKTKK